MLRPTDPVRPSDGSGPAKWAELAWPDLGPALASDAAGEHVGLVPVGAVEQHGPHLPTGTDTIVATALCERAGAATGALVLPPIALGVSYGHGTVLPGTLSLTPDLLVGIVHTYVRWAAFSGLRRLLFVNSHLGNTAALGVATDTIRLAAPQLRVGIVDWWAVDPEVSAEVTEDGTDIHANAAETSIMLAVAPQLVRTDRIGDADDVDRTDELVFRYTAPALSRNGVTGRPSQATATAGHRLVDRVVAAIAGRVERGRIEQPPLGPAPVPTFPF
jgi:creatinine amidohydrolase